MTDQQVQFLKELAEKYSLTKDDFFKSKQGWAIIKRNGIEKIQAAEQIGVEYSSEKLEKDFVVILARADYGDKYMESYGEATKENCKNQYLVATAEKRALGRVVLKIVGAYSMGIFSEDEQLD